MLGLKSTHGSKGGPGVYKMLPLYYEQRRDTNVNQMKKNNVLFFFDLSSLSYPF